MWRGRSVTSAWPSTPLSVWDSVTPGYAQFVLVVKWYIVFRWNKEILSYRENWWWAFNTVDIIEPPFPLVSTWSWRVEKLTGVFNIRLIRVFVCGEQDSNMRDILGPRFLIQRGCTYNKVEYRTAILPGCPVDANPAFTYPVALSCHCGACRTDSDECAHRASVDGARCTKPVRHLYPYPGQSSYMIPFWFFCHHSQPFKVNRLSLNDSWAKHRPVACIVLFAVKSCTSLFCSAFVVQHVCAASQFTTEGFGSWNVFCLLLCTWVCDSQIYFSSERDTLNAVNQLK